LIFGRENKNHFLCEIIENKHKLRAQEYFGELFLVIVDNNILNKFRKVSYLDHPACPIEMVIDLLV
jgi:hypothetical protein